MSIKPEFVEKILSDEKLYEFRKSVFKENPERIFIYSTYPEKRIVGHFTPDEIICRSPKDLWDSFSEVSGISREDFFRYYADAEKGYAIRIADLNVFDEPIDMDRYKDFRAPQSFCYVENNELLRRLLLSE
jgi:type I restriction enzyme S subunit